MGEWTRVYEKNGIFGLHPPKKDDTFNNLKYVKKTKNKDKHGNELHVFECICGKKIQKPLSPVIAGYIKDCGCQIDKKLKQPLSEINGENLRKRDKLYERAFRNREIIYEIAKFATEEGLSYGNYVAKYGL